MLLALQDPLRANRTSGLISDCAQEFRLFRDTRRNSFCIHKQNCFSLFAFWANFTFKGTEWSSYHICRTQTKQTNFFINSIYQHSEQSTSYVNVLSQEHRKETAKKSVTNILFIGLTLALFFNEEGGLILLLLIVTSIQASSIHVTQT